MSMIGKSIIHYEITSQLGKGGMGEVYQAKDTKLGRDVAIKILPEEFARDADRVARFQREAKLLASLNHPNIAAIYGLEESGGTNFLVMELIEGQTLADRIKTGPIPVEEALKLALQIAEALEAAHEKGVIHRDLKPANIKVTPEGKVKVLDFGLAKAFAEDQGEERPKDSPTLSNAATRQGIILGTAAYMSPEQARGKPVDKRADIWAFGVILYEMLTGRQLFNGETVSDTMALVMTQDAELDKIPIKVRHLLKRCLLKDPKLRLRDIGDAPALLELVPEIEYKAHSKQSNRFAWGVAALAALFAVVSIIFVFLEKPQKDTELRLYKINSPDNVSPGPTGRFAISPDGIKLAFEGTDIDNTKLWIRRLDSFESRPVPGTEVSGAGHCIFWSPDSRFVAYDAGDRLLKVDVSTGSVRKICNLSGGVGGGSWNRDGVLIFYDKSKKSLMRLPDTGGKASLVMEPDPSKGELILAYPVFLPDDTHFLYYCISNDPETQGIYIGNLDAKPDEQIRKKVYDTNYVCQYVPSTNSDSGYLLTIEDNDIVATHFDNKSLEVTDSASLLAQNVAEGWMFGFFSASNNGVLVYRERIQKQFQWIGRDGTVLEKIGEPGEYSTFDLSRDANQLVVGKIKSGNSQELWLFDMSRKGLSKPLTFEDVQNVDPRWSHDGDFIIYGSTQDIARSPFKTMIPSLNTEQVFKFNGNMFSLDDISPDNEFLLYHDSRVPELWVRSLTGDKERELVAKYPTGMIDQAQFSPDGHWIAFHSNEAGRFEVKVVPFPPTGEEWQISTAGGIHPTWGIDGRELYFLAPDGMLMAVDILIGETFEFNNIRSLFPSISGDVCTEDYAPDPKGERFLFLKPLGEYRGNSLNVILNWNSILEQ